MRKKFDESNSSSYKGNDYKFNEHIDEIENEDNRLSLNEVLNDNNPTLSKIRNTTISNENFMEMLSIDSNVTHLNDYQTNTNNKFKRDNSISSSKKLNKVGGGMRFFSNTYGNFEGKVHEKGVGSPEVTHKINKTTGYHKSGYFKQAPISAPSKIANMSNLLCTNSLVSGSHTGFYLEKPKLDEQIEAMYQNLMNKRDFKSLPNKATEEMNNYNAEKKWMLIYQDALSEFKKKERLAHNKDLTSNPEFYTKKLLSKKILNEQLKNLWISLRTEPIDWVRSFIYHYQGDAILSSFLIKIQEQINYAMINDINDEIFDKEFNTLKALKCMMNQKLGAERVRTDAKLYINAVSGSLISPRILTRKIAAESLTFMIVYYSHNVNGNNQKKYYEILKAIDSISKRSHFDFKIDYISESTISNIKNRKNSLNLNNSSFIFNSKNSLNEDMNSMFNIKNESEKKILKSKLIKKMPNQDNYRRFELWLQIVEKTLDDKDKFLSCFCDQNEDLKNIFTGSSRTNMETHLLEYFLGTMLLINTIVEYEIDYKARIFLRSQFHIAGLKELIKKFQALSYESLNQQCLKYYFMIENDEIEFRSIEKISDDVDFNNPVQLMDILWEKIKSTKALTHLVNAIQHLYLNLCDKKDLDEITKNLKFLNTLIQNGLMMNMNNEESAVGFAINKLYSKFISNETYQNLLQDLNHFKKLFEKVTAEKDEMAIQLSIGSENLISNLTKEIKEQESVFIKLKKTNEELNEEVSDLKKKLLLDKQKQELEMREILLMLDNDQKINCHNEEEYFMNQKKDYHNIKKKLKKTIHNRETEYKHDTCQFGATVETNSKLRELRGKMIESDSNHEQKDYSNYGSDIDSNLKEGFKKISLFNNVNSKHNNEISISKNSFLEDLKNQFKYLFIEIKDLCAVKDKFYTDKRNNLLKKLTSYINEINNFVLIADNNTIGYLFDSISEHDFDFVSDDLIQNKLKRIMNLVDLNCLYDKKQTNKNVNLSFKNLDKTTYINGDDYSHEVTKEIKDEAEDFDQDRSIIKNDCFLSSDEISIQEKKTFNRSIVNELSNNKENNKQDELTNSSFTKPDIITQNFFKSTHHSLSLRENNNEVFVEDLKINQGNTNFEPPSAPPFPSLFASAPLRDKNPPPAPPLPPLLSTTFLNLNSGIKKKNETISNIDQNTISNDRSFSLISNNLNYKFNTYQNEIKNSEIIDINGFQKFPRPKKKLKQLHWDKIEIGTLNSFWNNINSELITSDLTSKGIFDEIELIFAAKEIKKLTTKKKKDIDKVSFLSRDVSQQFSINLHAFNNLTDEELIFKVLDCDPDINENSAVLEFFIKEEIVEITNSLARNFEPYSTNYKSEKVVKPDKDSNELQRPDRIFLELIYNLQHYWKSRIRALIMILHFEKDYTDLVKKLKLIDEAVEAVKNSKHLKKVFQIILTIGNYMNDTTKQANGFKLNSLQRLGFMKDDKNSMTLLHYIEKIIRTLYPESLKFLDELAICNEVSKISIDSIANNCNEYFKTIKNVQNSIDTGNLSDVSKFHPQDKILKYVLPSLSKATKKAELLIVQTNCSVNEFNKLIRYFGEDSNDSFIKNSFINRFSNFLFDFKKAQTENLKHEEELRIYEQRKKLIEIPKASEYDSENSDENNVMDFLLEKLKAAKPIKDSNNMRKRVMLRKQLFDNQKNLTLNKDSIHGQSLEYDDLQVKSHDNNTDQILLKEFDMPGDSKINNTETNNDLVERARTLLQELRGSDNLQVANPISTQKFREERLRKKLFLKNNNSEEDFDNKSL